MRTEALLALLVALVAGAAAAATSEQPVQQQPPPPPPPQQQQQQPPPQSCGSGTPVEVGGVTYKTKYSVLKDGAGSLAVHSNGTQVSAAVVGVIATTLKPFWNSSNPPVAPGTDHPSWFTYSFVLPPHDGGLIVGFDVGSAGMKVGEVRELCIPPEEGYG
eukprot:COSAG02_NODE_23377_length_720_cov_1.571659_1_plen_159_part_01